MRRETLKTTQTNCWKTQNIIGKQRKLLDNTKNWTTQKEEVFLVMLSADCQKARPSVYKGPFYALNMLVLAYTYTYALNILLILMLML